MTSSNGSKKHAILAIRDTIGEPIEIPEWPGVDGLTIRHISGAERDRLEIHASKIGDGDTEAARGFRALSASLFLGDEQGERIFGDEDIEDLDSKSGAALERIREAGYRVNGYDAAQVDEMEGNSPAAPSGDSGFASPSPSVVPSDSCRAN